MTHSMMNMEEVNQMRQH